MRNLIGLMALIVVGGIAGQALAGGECCDKAKAANGWCAHCKVGYVAGVSVKNEAMHKAMAGVTIPADSKCDGCKKAMASNGTCDHCHFTFANKTAYKSPVARDMMMGDCMAGKEIKCEACKKASADHGWCDTCKAGMVGCIAFKDKAAYDKAVAAQAILVEALMAGEKCEGCGVAMLTDGKCEKCKVAYKGGKKSG